MEQNYELNTLRAIREINIAIRELQNQSAAISKRYKIGIRDLLSEIDTLERDLDEGLSIDGIDPLATQGEYIKKLISDPSLENIS